MRPGFFYSMDGFLVGREVFRNIVHQESFHVVVEGAVGVCSFGLQSFEKIGA